MSFKFGNLNYVRMIFITASEGKNSEFIFGDSVIMFIIFFGIVIFSMISAMIFNLLKNLQEIKCDNKVDIKKENVIIVNKRQSICAEEDNSTDNSYYMTFEDEEGERMEFSVSTKEHRYLVEGDIGILYYQGTEYLSFERKDSLS